MGKRRFLINGCLWAGRPKFPSSFHFQSGKRNPVRCWVAAAGRQDLRHCPFRARLIPRTPGKRRFFRWQDMLCRDGASLRHTRRDLLPGNFVCLSLTVPQSCAHGLSHTGRELPQSGLPNKDPGCGEARLPVWFGCYPPSGRRREAFLCDRFFRNEGVAFPHLCVAIDLETAVA